MANKNTLIICLSWSAACNFLLFIINSLVAEVKFFCSILSLKVVVAVSPIIDNKI